MIWLFEGRPLSDVKRNLMSDSSSGGTGPDSFPTRHTGTVRDKSSSEEECGPQFNGLILSHNIRPHELPVKSIAWNGEKK
ncbi:hypothetical protein E2C01_041836 [Portunus trituberculatus]|uniref:Uncharacterized protein n=1 Tax=Portunus trituberculatus TaxID=210409 RepID=A0A5B7FKW8_PORTR|nr:hypothetical protein [Portunus trituberculatus]